MIENTEQLYVSIKASFDINKGGFAYVHFKPKQDGDIVTQYKKIEIVDFNTILISSIDCICSNLKLSSNTSYSFTEHKTNVEKYTFKELTESKYWKDITDRYKYLESAHSNYKKNEIDSRIDKVYADFRTFKGENLSIVFNKESEQIQIDTNNYSYWDDISKLVFVSEDEYLKMEEALKILEMQRAGKNIQVVKNGYVIDNTFYVDLEEYKEESSLIPNA